MPAKIKYFPQCNEFHIAHSCAIRKYCTVVENIVPSSWHATDHAY